MCPHFLVPISGRFLEAQKAGLNLLYYIFLNNIDIVNKIKKNQKFKFKGNLVTCTPINTALKSYIFDIVFIDGSVVGE